jgi:hypothetical protein
MTDLPSAEQLAAQLEETTAALDGVRGEIAQMKALAEAANATHDYGSTEFEDWPAPEEFVAAPPARPALPPPVRQPVQTLNQEQLATQGIGLVAASVPDWNQYAERVLANAAENPAPFSRALSSGDPQVVASSLASSLAQVKTADSNRAMKLAAQSAVGASGRPDAPSGDVAEWQSIVAAAPRNYWGS